MFQFLCSCGDDRDAAKMLQKWDTFNDAAIDGAGYNGTKAFGSGVTPYTQVRCVKRISYVPAHEVLYGFRWWCPAGTFPLSSSYAWYILNAIHYAGTSPFHPTSTKQLSLNVLNDGKLELRRGNYNGTVLKTTTTQVLFNNTWAFVEVLATIAAAGSVLVMINGVQVLTFSGNTQHLSTPAFDGVEFVPWKIDDIYICDTNAPNNFFVGPRFHVLANPMAGAYLSEWTPGGASNLATIDDPTPDGIANTAVGTGLTDLFTPTALDAEVGTILAVQSNLTTKKGSNASPFKVADVVEISGVRSVGTDLDPQSTFQDLRTIREFQPSGAAWTRDVYNASKRGYRKTA